MNTKNENRKFTFEKFEVAKLTIMKVIKGGSAGVNGGNDDTGTGTQQNNSSKNCQGNSHTILKA